MGKKLKNRLLDLAHYAGSPFTELVGDAEAWAEEVKTARNSLVHHDGGRPERPPASRLHYLSESIFYLVVLCLLREAGMNDELLNGVAGNKRYQWLKTRLADTP